MVVSNFGISKLAGAPKIFRTPVSFREGMKHSPLGGSEFFRILWGFFSHFFHAEKNNSQRNCCGHGTVDPSDSTLCVWNSDFVAVSGSLNRGIGTWYILTHYQEKYHLYTTYSPCQLGDYMLPTTLKREPGNSIDLKWKIGHQWISGKVILGCRDFFCLLKCLWINRFGKETCTTWWWFHSCKFLPR